MHDECRTRYPVVLVHGAGFRDLKWPVYWGRIPNALIRNGASVYYGLQDLSLIHISDPTRPY